LLPPFELEPAPEEVDEEDEGVEVEDGVEEGLEERWRGRGRS
jgi:hypothetical protein